MPHVVAGRYRLVREIGRGGMGAVWLAHDATLDRQVALKRVGLVPGTEVADLERVRREAQVAAMLNHPNVVAALDLVDEGDRHWLVMEYVEGQTLGELAAHRPLHPDSLAPIIAQAARGLAVAHRAGVVHRDVKPGNILVTRAGVAKLGDFGIARADSDHTLTQTGLVTGSPAYLAPEVASGSPATPASDVWSLGATLFHGVTGRPPYDTSSSHLMAALYRLVNEEPPRTDRAGWLAPVLEATMDRDPGSRWTAAQVADFLERGPATATPEPTRVRPPIGAIVGVLLLAVVTVVAVLAAVGGDGTPSGSGSLSAPTSAPTTPPATAAPTAAGMERFVRDYLSAAVQDTRRAFDTMLTPGFQRESGGFDGYSGFWSTIASADLLEVRADPASLTVRYRVAYRLRGRGGDGDEGDDEDEDDGTDGEKRGSVEDSVTLVLVWDGSAYRIAAER